MQRSLPTDKNSLRAEMLAARGRIDVETSKTAAVALARHMVEAVPVEGIVAGYVSARGEIGMHESLAELSERGHALCLPVVRGKNEPLVFRRWRIDHPLEMGQFGIRVPPETEPELIPEIVIVPLVAFDAAGHRLGYGAGYYDRTIAGLRRRQKNITIIGAAYASQRVGSIPAEAHDEGMDMVVTERGIITPPHGGVRS
ncbi:MAG: 5-formyltetrahydrofolate cyclo-ligase [Pseudomonadota bacterium]|nr:5-formyltetrahydrofolate cyclo-ligase [Pseudomonadota bacterium]MDE3038250.1 5-formyltetrahydrofolate cyclo-ligase [Pseudomonadota bacterium]